MLASPKRLDLYRLAAGYELCARSEGKSENSIKIVLSSISYLDRFLASVGASGDVSLIGPNELRGFILYLQNRRSFSGYPFSHPQDRKLSDQMINCYMRSLLYQNTSYQVYLGQLHDEIEKMMQG